MTDPTVGLRRQDEDSNLRQTVKILFKSRNSLVLLADWRGTVNVNPGSSEPTADEEEREEKEEEGGEGQGEKRIRTVRVWLEEGKD